MDNKMDNYLVGKLFKKMNHEDQAIEYLEEAVKEGHEKAKILLIDIYEQNGFKHRKDEDEDDDNELTLYWYEKSANLGSRHAHIWLGKIYYKKKDYDNAFNSFKISNEDKKGRDSIYLGACYLSGSGVKQDYKKAFDFFHEVLAEQSSFYRDAHAEYCLGIIYKDGKGVEKDVPKAIEYFHKAARRHAASSGILGWMYYYGGLGAEQDYAKALYWTQKAVDDDDKLGNRMLKTIIRKLNG